MATVLTSNLSGGEEGDLLEKQLSLAARISFRFNATCCCPFFFFLDSVSSFSCFSLRDFCSQFLEGGEGENHREGKRGSRSEAAGACVTFLANLSCSLCIVHMLKIAAWNASNYIINWQMETRIVLPPYPISNSYSILDYCSIMSSPCCKPQRITLCGHGDAIVVSTSNPILSFCLLGPL